MLQQTARATNETTLISPDDFKCAASALPKADDVHLRLLQANVSNQPSVFPPLDKQKLAETIVHLLQVGVSVRLCRMLHQVILWIFVFLMTVF